MSCQPLLPRWHCGGNSQFLLLLLHYSWDPPPSPHLRWEATPSSPLRKCHISPRPHFPLFFFQGMKKGGIPDAESAKATEGGGNISNSLQEFLYQCSKNSNHQEQCMEPLSIQSMRLFSLLSHKLFLFLLLNFDLGDKRLSPFLSLSPLFPRKIP